MFTEHSWRCGGTKSHSRSPFRDYTLWSRWQGEAGQRRVFWHSRFTIHPLGFYCFRFGSNWAATWARLRPRVQTLPWLHISAVIKLATRQNRLQLYSRRCVSAPPNTTFQNCMDRTSEILPATTCWSSKGTWTGKYDILSLDSAQKWRPAVERGFDLPSQTDKNNTALIYQHMKSCMHTKHKPLHTFSKIFLFFTRAHSYSTTQSQTALLKLKITFL